MKALKVFLLIAIAMFWLESTFISSGEAHPHQKSGLGELEDAIRLEELKVPEKPEQRQGIPPSNKDRPGRGFKLPRSQRLTGPK
ncbi:hypothetical protein ACROYT_G030204 [Oculina patagonica]